MSFCPLREACLIFGSGRKVDTSLGKFGFGVATWACWQGFVAATGVSKATLGLVSLAALAGMGLGAINEIVEFIASQTMHTNVGGYINTGGDLIANLLGSVVVGAIILGNSKRGDGQPMNAN